MKNGCSEGLVVLLWEEIRILGEPAVISKFLCPGTVNWICDIWAGGARELVYKEKSQQYSLR